MKRVESLPPAITPASMFPAPAAPDDSTGPDFKDVLAAQKASATPAEQSEPARRSSANPEGPSHAGDTKSPRSAHSASGAPPHEAKPDHARRSVAGDGEAAGHSTGKPSHPKHPPESSGEDGSADADVADEDTPSPNYLLGETALAIWASDKVLGAVAPPSSGAIPVSKKDPPDAKGQAHDLSATVVPGDEGVAKPSGKTSEPSAALVPGLMAENEEKPPGDAKMPTAAVLAKRSGQSSPVPVPLAPEPQNPDHQSAGKPSAAPITPPGEPSVVDHPDSAAAPRTPGFATAINFESLRARALDRLAPSAPDDDAHPSTSPAHSGAPESRRVEAEVPPAVPAGTAETSARLARRFSEGAFQGEGALPGERTPEPSRPESALLWDRSPNMVRDGRTESPSSADPASARPLSLELIQELAQRTRTLVQSGGRSEIRIALYPEHLGEVHLRALLDGRHISASILTESPAARDFLERHLTFLQHALTEQGLDVGRIEIRQTDSFSSALSGDGRSSAQHEAPPRPPSPSSDRSDSHSWGPGAAPDAAAPAPRLGGAGIINLLV